VQTDDSTLAESPDEALLRAGFGQGDDYEILLRTNLRATSARHRVLALRGATRQSLVTIDDWLFALDDPDPEVRREALNLIAYVEFFGVADPIFARMLELLSDPDPLVVDGAVFALGEHQFIEAVDQLSEVAMHHDDARCRESAVAALGALGDDRGRQAVLGALDDKPPVRRRAIVALANFEGPDIDEALRRASEDRDWQVRAAADQLGRGED
jgi:HEAT repeat protein